MAIRELTPAEALERQRAGALLVDVRAAGERALGMAAGAIGISRDDLLRDPSDRFPDRDAELLLLCQRGMRSLDCAAQLEAAGYRHLATVAGGTEAWQAAGLPMQGEALDADFAERYSRQLRLPEVGLDGQRRLQRARVLILGAGGLGSPAALYLAAAGVGRLRIVDDDVVERSNLQRQILHADARIDTPKVASAAQAITALNPGTQVEAVDARLQKDNVERLLDGVDVAIDGSDNFTARYLLNDACVTLGKPLVYGAVQRFEGQVAVFDAGHGDTPCYRCLYPQPPAAGAVPNCSEAGVLGVLPGIIGLLQATEAIKLLLGIGEPLRGRLLQVDALAMRFHELRLSFDPACPVCAAKHADSR